MTDNELKVIRQNIACPQFGDDHYGAWGALRLDQRREIYKMWNEINRQKAEIKRLRELIDARHKVFETKCEELEIAKAEAIKEFAYRLKEDFNYYCNSDGAEWYAVDYDDFYNLVKEMAGDIDV